MAFREQNTPSAQFAGSRGGYSVCVCMCCVHLVARREEAGHTTRWQSNGDGGVANALSDELPVERLSLHMEPIEGIDSSCENFFGLSEKTVALGSRSARSLVDVLLETAEILYVIQEGLVNGVDLGSIHVLFELFHVPFEFRAPVLEPCDHLGVCEPQRLRDLVPIGG